MIKKIIRNVLLILGYRIIKISDLRKNKRFQLQTKHIDNATLLTTREELLTKLPKNGIVAELGVDQGEFSKKILKINKPKKLYLIDSWESRRYNETKFVNVKLKFSKEIKIGMVEIVRKRSEVGLKEFKNKTFDWVYIDTSHSYDQTKIELNIASKKIKARGYITGHDYTPGNVSIGLRYGVIRAVNEFCVKKNWRLVYLTLDANSPPSFCIQKI